MGDLDPFVRKIDTFTRDLAGEGGKALINAIGLGAKDDIEEAVRRDLGDTSMSGWRRGKPIQVRGMYTVNDNDTVTIEPGRPSRGPMRVLEDGRNRGNSGGFQGPGVNARTGKTLKSNAGKVKVRTRRTKRWNGYTTGKHTWSDAIDVILRETPERAQEAFRKLITRSFGG